MKNLNNKYILEERIDAKKCMKRDKRKSFGSKRIKKNIYKFCKDVVSF